jgi:magnesium chelatase family protein
MLVAACNGCSCGRRDGECTCNDADRARYHRRLSGPLLDRIDLVCALRSEPALELVGTSTSTPESSAAVRERVVAARELQYERLAGTGLNCNATMDPRLTRTHARLTQRLRETLAGASHAGALTVRGQDRALRLARTIADLDGRDRVETRDLEEAIGYRLGATEAVAA